MFRSNGLRLSKTSEEMKNRSTKPTRRIDRAIHKNNIQVEGDTCAILRDFKEVPTITPCWFGFTFDSLGMFVSEQCAVAQLIGGWVRVR